MTADGMMVPWPRKREFKRPSCADFCPCASGLWGYKSASSLLLGETLGCKFQILASGWFLRDRWMWAAAV